MSNSPLFSGHTAASPLRTSDILTPAGGRPQSRPGTAPHQRPRSLHTSYSMPSISQRPHTAQAQGSRSASRLPRPRHSPPSSPPNAREGRLAWAVAAWSVIG